MQRFKHIPYFADGRLAAERVLQATRVSVLAVKPADFVSPVVPARMA